MLNQFQCHNCYLRCLLQPVCSWVVLEQINTHCSLSLNRVARRQSVFLLHHADHPGERFPSMRVPCFNHLRRHQRSGQGRKRLGRVNKPANTQLLEITPLRSAALGPASAEQCADTGQTDLSFQKISSFHCASPFAAFGVVASAVLLKPLLAYTRQFRA